MNSRSIPLTARHTRPSTAICRGWQKLIQALRYIGQSLYKLLPRLAEAYTGFAQYTANYDSIRPKVVSIDEFTNGDTTVRSDIKTITVHFDRPLVGRGHSFNYGHLGMEAMPKIINVNYANDNRTVIIGVELLPGKEYGITLLGLSFRTPEGDAIKPYEISFKTAE